MIDSVAAWAAGFIAGASIGFFYGNRLLRDRDPDWRRSFNHENANRPSGPAPLKLRRSGDAGSLRPCTPKPDIAPKPQFPPPRKIRTDWP